MGKARLIAWLMVWACSPALLQAEDPAPASAAAPTYNDHVAPLFKTYCVGCHNPSDKEGGLVLARYADLLAGGDNGAVLAAGKPEQSRLLLVLTGKAEPAMPPEGSEQPKPEEIARLDAWIKAGAKGPDGVEPDPSVVVAPRIKPHGNVREAVAALAFSADGKRLAVARYGAVEVLAWPERTLVRRLEGVRGRINSVSFSADGARLVAAGGEPGVMGEAKIFRLSDGQPLVTVRGHLDSLYAAVLSPDGSQLATSSYDQQIKLWNAADGQELKTLAGHNDAVFDLAYRNDGRVLASASGDRTVKLWNVATGERLDTFGQPLKELYTVAFSPDGTRVSAGGVDNRIRQWQISPDAKENTNPLLVSRFAHEGAIVKLVYAADGKTLVTAGEDRTLKIWDAINLTERLELERQTDWAGALAITPDGKQVAVGRLDGTLAYYDATNGNPLPAPEPVKPDLAALSAKGIQAGVTNRVQATGMHLAEVTAVKASHEKLTGRVVQAGAGTQLELELTPAADLPRGNYEVWLINAAGESSKRSVYVDELAQGSEVEPNNALAQANPVALGSGTWGVLSAKGDVDTFSFEAKAGQHLVFDLAASRIGSKANAFITLHDAAGRVLADNNDFGTSSDPLLAFDIPADGRYLVQVSDLTLAGGGDNVYRLSLGELAVPTAVYPQSVPAGQESEVEISGYNLPGGLKVKLPAKADGQIEVPLDVLKYRVIQPLTVVVGTLGETREIEPNDAPGTATPLAVPGTINGRLLPPTSASAAATSALGDNDYFRFESKAGESWIVETEAARRGSPVDTVIEVLSADGRPIERVLLQGVRDSNVTFRPIDGNTRDCRLTNWEEMQLNQFVYLNGEVVKLFRSPQGPDSGFLFYEGDGGKRQCYFDTTATVHAVEEPAFIVEAHAPGTKLISTGLPIIPVYYTNDDDAQRRLGSDSRLTFTAPADGQYVVRVRDARSAGGDRFTYRLTVRRPAPDFNVRINAPDSIPAGSGKQFTVSVDRVDGFDGEVQVEIANLPEGFKASSPIVIQAGHRDARGVLTAAADAAAPTAEQLAKVSVSAKAMLNQSEVVKPVEAFRQLKPADKPKLLVRLEPAELTVAPGATITAMLKVERNGYNDLIQFTVENMPHGVIVDNIGLSGVLMPKGESERQIFITADSWVPETTRLCFAVENKAGSQASAPVTIHVRKPSPLAAGK